MKILALETDLDKLNRSFLSPGEEIVLAVRFHSFVFVLRTLGSLLMTIVLVGAGTAAISADMPSGVIVPILAIAWAAVPGRALLRALIDWQFDELVVTTDKIIVVDQSSLFRQEIQQMNLENLASVKAITQYWGLLPFGRLHFDLKEGTGKAVKLGYIPRTQRVCSLICDVMVKFQRR